MSLNEEKLLPFYFGILSDEQRLQIERDLLLDEELLLDFLDLKRRREGAAEIPSQPSPQLWRRLRPQAVSRKVWWISLAFGAAVAAALCLMMMRPSSTSVSGPSSEKSGSAILFDSGAEPSSVSNVL